MQLNLNDAMRMGELGFQTFVIIAGVWLGYKRVADNLALMHVHMRELQNDVKNHISKIDKLEKFAIQQQVICKAMHPDIEMPRIKFFE